MKGLLKWMLTAYIKSFKTLHDNCAVKFTADNLSDDELMKAVKSLTKNQKKYQTLSVKTAIFPACLILTRPFSAQAARAGTTLRKSRRTITETAALNPSGRLEKPDFYPTS